MFLLAVKKFREFYEPFQTFVHFFFFLFFAVYFLNIFINIDQLYEGVSLCHFHICIQCTLIGFSPPSFSSSLSPVLETL
jgi:hypothetical protein